MFALLGIAEVFWIAVIGGFATAMLFVPTHRGWPLLRRRRCDVSYDRWPAVLIRAAHAGATARLLTLINKAPLTSLEAAPDLLKYHIDGIFSPHATGSVPYQSISTVKVETWHPKYHVTTMGLVGFVMLVYGMVGRLTLQGFVLGTALVGLVSILAAMQRTNNLVIRFEDAKQKPLIFAFSTVSLDRKQPAMTHVELCAAADRIMQLVSESKHRAA
jgi:hypothetical protein